MKENKVNIFLIVPYIGTKYNLFVPVNKTIGEIVLILNNSINELTGSFPLDNKLSLFDVMENIFYDNDLQFVETKIKNGSVLALI